MKVFTYILCVFFLFHIRQYSAAQDTTAQNCVRIMDADSLDYWSKKKSWLALKNPRKNCDPRCALDLLNESLYNGDTSFFKKELTFVVRNFGFQVTPYIIHEEFYPAISSGHLAGWFSEMSKKEYSSWKLSNPEAYYASEELYILFDYDQFLMKTSNVLFENSRTKIDSLFAEEFIDGEYQKIFDRFKNLCEELGEVPTNFNSGFMGGNIANLIIDHSLGNRELFNQRWDVLYPFWKKAFDKGHTDDWALWLYDEMSIFYIGCQRYNTHKDQKTCE
jgi:hypothetical protein